VGGMLSQGHRTFQPSKQVAETRALRGRPLRCGWRRGRLRRAAEVGPPGPVRRSKSGESGEWVTEAEPAEAAPVTGPARLAGWLPLEMSECKT
jgi:hypothetical protein